ncbi:MAG: ERCC4 domain-containing protein [Desulfobacterales bacterium]
MKRQVHIIMDDRERSIAVFRELTAMDGISIDIRRLAIGDYLIDGRLLCERKTLQDFAASVVDGRLFRQMTRLTTSPLKGMLILEGTSRDLNNTGLRREALQGALITICVIMGIPVLRSMNPGETARLLVFAARQSMLAISGGLPRAGYRPKGRRKQQLYILQGLPGVGPTRAARLLDQFGSVNGIFNASVEALASVDGIGGDTARKIKWAVSESVLPYGDDMKRGHESEQPAQSISTRSWE